MKTRTLLPLVLATGAMSGGQHAAVAQTTAAPAHVSNSFRFFVPAPLNRASALFGPDGERCWAGEHWKPRFIHPQPAEDIQGAVFTVQHGPHTSVWVNTIFDPVGGRMQYVSFIPETLVFTVDVRLSVLTPSTTKVEVTYVRTALDAAANEDVLALGKRDGENGPEWQKAIEDCLAAERKTGHE
ncbi:hypothetical protein [Tunturiibacter gelidoferens]|uniref:SRPBCC domain-containing protein n=2 Tax=Tunturiibacter gelidiferens TaxID=3069689 RepID=A0AAU7Z173_9BACT|nr:hypothetical protein [Edaphobacter lichenicola]MBB5341849.1 hypothetical protein [Edaphobacter lichenicola]